MEIITAHLGTTNFFLWFRWGFPALQWSMHKVRGHKNQAILKRMEYAENLNPKADFNEASGVNFPIGSIIYGHSLIV